MHRIKKTHSNMEVEKRSCCSKSISNGPPILSYLPLALKPIIHLKIILILKWSADIFLTKNVWLKLSRCFFKQINLHLMNLFSWLQCALKGSCYRDGDRQCVSGVRSEQVHRHTQPTWPDLTWLCTLCWNRTSPKGLTKTKAALQKWNQATWGQFPSCTCCWRWW